MRRTPAELENSFRQDNRAEPQLIPALGPALFQCWVNFTLLFLSILQTSVCDIPGAHQQVSKKS